MLKRLCSFPHFAKTFSIATLGYSSTQSSQLKELCRTFSVSKENQVLASLETSQHPDIAYHVLSGKAMEKQDDIFPFCKDHYIFKNRGSNSDSAEDSFGLIVGI
jgi:hypothetical protein